MIRWIVPLAAITAAALVLAPIALAQTKPESGTPDSGTGDVKLTPETFAQKALLSGEKEVALAQLAAAQSKNTGVKQFAEMIVADHTRVNEQLRLMAQQGAGPNRAPDQSNEPASPPPASPGAAPSGSPEQKELSGLSGAAFDKAFMGMMVDGHSKSVELYEQATQSLPAGAARKLADDTLPKIKQHLEQAKSLAAEVGAEKK